MAKSIWLLVSGGLILLGFALFALQPGPPEPVCAASPSEASGFSDPTQDCPISIDSMNAIRDYRTSPKWFRIAGVAVGAGGFLIAALAGIAGVRTPRRE